VSRSWRRSKAAAANLAHDNPIWPMAQSCLQKIADAYLQGGRSARGEPRIGVHFLLNLYLRCVLDQDNAFVAGRPALGCSEDP
jgi:hypothetical protein